jgi:hypothetical protein
MSKLQDLAGRIFGRWTVEHRVPSCRTKWRCRCECGNIAEVFATNLTRGLSISCGCYANELASKRSKRHGLHKTPIYRVWKTMIQRCSLTTSKSYPVYGGRGIIVCPKWRTFDGFFADMGHPPFFGAQLDRVNTDGPYSKENCRWVTSQRNNRNRRNNRPVSFCGVVRLAVEWDDVCGFPHPTVSNRLNLGWDVEDAIQIPLGRRRVRR